MVVDPDNSNVRGAAEELKDKLGVEPVYMCHGGSIPVVSLIALILQLPMILMDFELPDDAMHDPGEKFNLDQFRM